MTQHAQCVEMHRHLSCSHHVLVAPPTQQRLRNLNVTRMAANQSLIDEIVQHKEDQQLLPAQKKLAPATYAGTGGRYAQ